MTISRDYIKQKLLQPLLGLASHIKMAPPDRVDANEDTSEKIRSAKKSAVLILLFHNEGKLKVVLIRRSDYVGIHAGQFAFPGGRYEESDKDLRTTALREINEEIGIPEDKIEVLGRLSDIYVPPSNFLVSVFVGYLVKKPVYKIDEREVNAVFEVDLEEFLKENVVKRKDFYVQSVKASSNAPYYHVGEVELWGASAMVMTELLDLLNNQ